MDCPSAIGGGTCFAVQVFGDGFALSVERISGLDKLDPIKVVALFKQALEQPVEPSPYPATREDREVNRLLLLRFVNSVEPDKKYVPRISIMSNQVAAFRADPATPH